MVRLLITGAFCSGFLLGCSGYQVNTNLDSKNISDYFMPSRVTIYEKQQLANLNYQNLGTVEGESCQSSALMPPPLAADARTEARRKAAELGANGLLIDQCLLVDPSDDCIALMVCYGQALKIAKP